MCSDTYTANGINIGGSGNIYVTGEYACTADFDPGSGVLLLPNSGSRNIYVQKLTPSGALIWAKGIEGTPSSLMASFATTVDELDNVYIAGRFNGTVDFDPGIGVDSYTSPSLMPSSFVLKLNSLGELVWVKVFQSNDTSSIIASSIRVDSNHNLYLAGEFTGTSDFNPDAIAVDTITSLGSTDIFILKLTSIGDFVWVNHVGSSGQEIVPQLALDGIGGIYFSGGFSGNLDIISGTDTTAFYCSGPFDVLLSKIDTSGNFGWVKQIKAIGSASSLQVLSIEMDATNHILMAGQLIGSADFDPTASTALVTATNSGFTVKFDSSGSFSWVRNVDGNSIAIAVGADAMGHVYTLGTYGQIPNDFDPGSEVYSLPIISPTGFNLYVQCLDSGGDFLWAGGIPASDQVNVRSAAVTEIGDLYFSGYFIGSADFDPGVGISNLATPSSSDVYGFVEKLNHDAVEVTQFNTDEVIQVYPNPVLNTLNINSGYMEKALVVRLLDLLGRERIVSNQKCIDVSTLEPGIYILRIEVGDKHYTGRMVKS